MSESLHPDGAGHLWRPVGEAAWVLDAGASLDIAVNARMRATATEVTRLAIPGVRDVVPACASITVHVDPLRFPQEDAVRLPELALLSTIVHGRLREVPVVYDGEDLDALAASTGMAVDEIRRRHADVDYTVLMLGFAPGFPYLGPVDPGLVVGRRPTPRVRVPRGAVAIAGGMTCIYPGGTAGGWHILGRTSLRLFDPAAASPAALAPGDRVRFVPVEQLEPDAPVADDARGGAGAGACGLTVLRGGASTTVQDLGRWGFQSIGVPVSGACDAGALRWANRAVGNPDDAAGLEVAAVGPELRVEQDTVIAYTGADMDARIDGRAMLPGEPVVAREGAVIRCGQTRGGLRSYLAVAGGLDVPVVLGSRSTCLPGGFGGFAGRPLAAGDRVPVGRARDASSRMVLTGMVASGLTQSPVTPARRVAGEPVRLRVLPGPQRDAAGESPIERLLSETFQVSPQLNRVACRLHGQPSVAVPFGEMVPVGTVPGAIQVTPSGELLLLLADRQTTGGYPQVLSVIGADLGSAAQLCPGDAVRFVLCSMSEAIAARIAAEAMFLNHV